MIDEQEARPSTVTMEIDASSAAANDVVDDAIDDFVEALMTARQIPGMSLAVVQNQKLIKVKAYGQQDMARNVRTQPSSLFMIGSISKPLTATAVMLLVQSGDLDLDAPIDNYLPTASAQPPNQAPEHLPDDWADITVRQLLSHTSGLSGRVYETNMDDILTPEAFISVARQAPLNFQPGESWMYSNTGYSLAATIVENVSGMPFETFMETRIFEPLGMDNTDVIRDSYPLRNLGYVSRRWGRGLRPIPTEADVLRQNAQIYRGAGGISSTAIDLARWAIAMQNNQLLSPALNAEMEQSTVMNSGRVFDYGLGWDLEAVNGHRVVAHGGSSWGFSNSVSQFPDDELTIVMLTNRGGEPGQELAWKIAEQYAPELRLDQNLPALATDNSVLTEKLLAYLQGDSDAISLTAERRRSLATDRGIKKQASFEQFLRENTVDALELIVQEPHANGMKYRYRAVTANQPLIVTAIVTPENELAWLGLFTVTDP